MSRILESAFAGTFFPADRNALREIVEEYLSCGCEPVPEAVGLVVPHAGYTYSGKTAGYAFASAPDHVKNVIICAPSHRFPLLNGAVLDVDGVETPLGICPVNRNTADMFSLKLDSVTFHEHSFEVMVPFVQVRWPDAEIVPVITGMSPNCREIAELVNRYAPDSIFIASSDLSHFHSLETANALDKMIIDGFLSLSPDEFRKKLDSGGEACGRYPILTLLHLAQLRNASRAVSLHYSTSADSGAGITEVVGYYSGLVSL